MQICRIKLSFLIFQVCSCCFIHKQLCKKSLPTEIFLTFLPAGGAGDQIIPSKDMTLYAQWVDLRLQSVDNYDANDGKGAVDLSWSQSDQNNKTYLVYQKREDGAWIRVNSANDISSC